MSAQDRTEQVLRDIHILFSKCEIYDKAENKIIVDKKEVLDLLNRLNVCIYEMGESYELTQQSRSKAEREVRRRREESVLDARRKAEDVYAASVLYTNEALYRAQDIMQEASDSVKKIYQKLERDLKKEREHVQRDQLELKSNLESMVDTEKYLKLIDARNKEIQREKEREKGEPERKRNLGGGVPSYAKSEIKVNPAYFQKAGIVLEGEEERLGGEAPFYGKPEIKVNPAYFQKAGVVPENEEEGIGGEVPSHAKPEIKVNPAYFQKAGVVSENEEESRESEESGFTEIKINLDAEYFKWKDENNGQMGAERKPEKYSLFGRLLKGES